MIRQHCLGEWLGAAWHYKTSRIQWRTDGSSCAQLATWHPISNWIALSHGNHKLWIYWDLTESANILQTTPNTFFSIKVLCLFIYGRSLGYNTQGFRIGWGKGFVLKRQKAVTWSNIYTVHLRQRVKINQTPNVASACTIANDSLHHIVTHWHELYKYATKF